MLIIPDSILRTEMEKASKYFSLRDVVVIAKKVNGGLGIVLMKTESRKIVKLKTTFKNVAGRVVFIVEIKTGDVIPVLLRLKKDEIGQNVSFKNKDFCEIFKKKLELINTDIVTGNYKEIII